VNQAIGVPDSDLSAQAAIAVLTSRVVSWYVTKSLYNFICMNTSEQLDATFSALSDPTRRAILARLTSGEATVMELAEPFAMTQPAISRHLKVLERAGLISQRQDAQRRPRRVEVRPIVEATNWLERYRQTLEENFQRLDLLLKEMQSQEKKHARTKRRQKLTVE
jgi:DNA-binding transcriptional ArsR family regulator